ncbi:MAG: Ig-like domain-containing protein, partial [Terrimicrobiaceae bacterium]
MAAATTAIVTATGTGTLAAITGTASVTSATATADLAALLFAGRGGTAVTTGWSLTTPTATGTTVNVRSTATSSTIELTHADVADATTAYGYIVVTDKGGKITGAPGSANTLIFDKSFTNTGTTATTETYSTITLSHSALGTTAVSDGGGFTFKDGFGTAVTTWSVSGATSSSASGAVTVTPSNARVAEKGSIAIQALVTDQFKLAMAGESVTTTVAGRNGTRTSEVQTTSSTGYVTSTITDAGTAGSTDVVTFTAATGSKTGTSSLTWGAFTVGKVAVTGGKTASDTYAGQNLTSISTAVAGPNGAFVSITATVTDASGNLLAGVPVTFAVSKGLIVKSTTVDYTTVYTGSLGTAVTRVIDWVEGTQTITATAGGVSGTDYLTWDANVASAARSIAGAADGNKVTATVKDRFGNTVNGVTVKAATSAGYFETGTNSTTGVTASDGTVSFFLNGANGAASVTLSLDKDTYGQSIDKTGEVGATAVTAAVAGTTTGTGASLAAAGVNSVVVAVEAVNEAANNAQAATDAAAEATDAANAAT